MSDLIQRQDAIDTALEFFVEFLGGAFHEDDQKILMKRMSELLSAEPERKTGKWIDEGFYADGHGAHAFRCSECGGHIIEYDADPFCRWCGAYLKGDR